MARVRGVTMSLSNVCGGPSNTKRSTCARAYASVSEARAGIGRYLTFYNSITQHPQD
jgi:hypothetical protein